MNISQSKENILKKIRQALSNQVPVPFPLSEGLESVFEKQQHELDITFAENFTKLQGKFSYCINEQELALQLAELIMLKNWKNIFCKEDCVEKNAFAKNDLKIDFFNDLKTCDASITSCEQLIARTGSIVLSSAQSRTISVYAPVHICIAYTSQLTYDIKEALINIREKYIQLPSLITLATGPSRTADIEKTLVVGVHGPKEVYCFLVEKN